MKPGHIILHHSLTKDGETVSWGAIRRYHTVDLGWRDIGYHFGIEQVGNGYEILTGRMMTQAGAHCREGGMNYQSLGICFVGNFDDMTVPDAQMALGVRLVRSLCDVFAIPAHNIFGHRNFARHKSCPGNHFDLHAFKQAVAAG